MLIDFKVGNELREIREAKHLSRAYLTEGICSVNTLVRIEANEQSPSLELMLALVDRLGISINTLIELKNHTRNTFYYTLKNKMDEANSNVNWQMLKELSCLVTDDVYYDLPIKEQQFVDRMRINVAKFLDEDFSYAHELANRSLAKTFDARTKNFYSPEEMQLFNIILQFDRSSTQLNLLKRSLLWVEEQPGALQDTSSLVALLTGLMVYNYFNNDWQQALHYATKGYKVAIMSKEMKFIPNFLFARGMCLYQTKLDVQGGCYDMKEALQLYLRFGMVDSYNNLLADIDLYNITLEG